MKPRIRKRKPEEIAADKFGEYRRWEVFEHNSLSWFPTWGAALAYALGPAQYRFC